MLRAITTCTFLTSEPPKMVRTWYFLYILTWECASTTACTFSTSQLPKVVREWCVLYFLNLGMCFAPQRRALFRHLNFQVLRPWCALYILTSKCRGTTACTFSTSPLPKVVRTLDGFNILTSKVLRATTACTFSTSQLPKVVRS